MRLLPTLALLLTAACARPAPPDSTAAPPHRRSGVAAIDTAAVRRLCAMPDSVLAGRRECELRDQRVRPIRIF